IGRGLSNDGDRLILEDSAETVIDAISYGDDDTIMLPPCQDVAAGNSLERQPAGLDTDQASDFVDNPNPTPGSGLAMPTPTPTPTSTPAPTPTAGPTATPTIAPTATPTTSPPSSPTPEDTTPTPEESPASPGVALRAIIITAALAFFAIVFWFGIKRRRK
ncbi:MAG: hypothetical protein KAW13_06360, partial [Dehalococcoidia bacterium]|nr:hypothetical protein [Dehalococcoidia bacterium]